uniref:Movement protein n=1 Tax=Brome mosaic virus TaxID=12302 RepID=A0SL69_BMV|nr:3a protein [Brome mosaic virus]
MSNIVSPFSGSSRTTSDVGKQAGGTSDEKLIESLFSEKAVKEIAAECKLGCYNYLKSNEPRNYIDLVPKSHVSAWLSWATPKYDKGELPSRGFMNVPRIVCFLVRTTDSAESGSITVSLCDSGKAARAGVLEAIDNQEATIQLSALPALIALTPSYDCPMEVIGGDSGRNRCFGIATQLSGVVGTTGSVAVTHAYWQANFKAKPNNYKLHGPATIMVMPFDRLRQLDKKSLKNYIRGISNQSVDHGYLLGRPLQSVDQVAQEDLLVEESESPSALGRGVKDSKSVSASSVAGLPVSSPSLRIK